VLEEGIDLQMCNLVIMYDHPEKLLSYVQTQGRARDSNSDYVILLEDSAHGKFTNNKNNWLCVSKELKDQLVFKTIDRMAPTKEDIMREQEQTWEPYITKNGSKLTALNALLILNQYVQSIPTDKFTSGSSVEWQKIIEGPKQIAVGIKLPPPSPLTYEVFGKTKENVQLAKQHAAFETVIKLYELGELTDSLTAVKSEQKIESVKDEYFGHWEKYANEPKKAGTKKNYRAHPIKTPTLLVNSTPKANSVIYLYYISIRPKFETDKYVYLKPFSEMLGNGKSFGILTSTRLPRLCAMSLFPSYGEVECKIDSTPFQIEIDSESDLEKLRNFQMTLFKDVINLWKPFYVIDRSGFIVVPVLEDKEIDWKLVNNFQTMLPAKRMTEVEAKSMKFKTSDYLNKVITKTHMSSNKFVVYKVDEKNTPLSTFPDKSTTYKEYYESKYNYISITRDDQFLLESRAISENWNFFFPGTY
jgi:endoribonuclease Dicer